MINIRPRYFETAKVMKISLYSELVGSEIECCHLCFQYKFQLEMSFKKHEL
ncbi:hypothetical protein BXY82_1038 [Gelidibacter sediminis]|uniref:Uncharacterized protein n=1 Tax=Gelidibacter sediminis TaxID=1608710 RepID=A0A4R7Q7J8_9FLAO|nr:hypothetical protein BXY82_1038 [Gelidibacter sediminis]